MRTTLVVGQHVVVSQKRDNCRHSGLHPELNLHFSIIQRILYKVKVIIIKKLKNKKKERI